MCCTQAGLVQSETTLILIVSLCVQTLWHEIPDLVVDVGECLVAKNSEKLFGHEVCPKTFHNNFLGGV
jgi:hypothetical protein